MPIRKTTLATFAALGILSASFSPTSFAAQKAQPAVSKAATKTDAAAPAPAVIINKTEISNFDFWHLQCDEFSDPKIGKKCAARMPVFKTDGQQLLSVLVITQDDSKQWILKVIIPTSISVADGASIGFDGEEGKPQSFAIETCEPTACAANLPLDQAMSDTLMASNKVTLAWTALDHSPVKFDFEIKGIQQTLKALFS